MRSLVVLAFETEDGAESVREQMYELQEQGLLTVDDAAIVVRRSDGRVKVKQAHSLAGVGALGGAFWGTLIGLLFLAPWLGLVTGTGLGTVIGKIGDIGLKPEFVEEVSETIETGHSALFLWTRHAKRERIREELSDIDFTIIHTDLPPDRAARLRETFAADGA
ncbi:DUF1269 domain-containing protein [Halosimplex marinum]|uniref:DUF1269 domain-containing protein n=1 Tax=Halosimplex marinum TaxID=3396620 RepID=UPI003F55FFCC